MGTPPPPLNPARTAARINRALFFVGAIFAFVGLRFFLDPDELAQTSVGHALGRGLFATLWSVLYIVGGLMLTVGIGLRRPRLQLPALTILGTAVIVNGTAIILVLSFNRAMSQIPLYVLVLWVFDGAIRDILALPRERRHGNDDPRHPRRRVERRIPMLLPGMFMASGNASPGASLLIALLGGGIVTAVAQALLVKPQRRDLEGRLSKTAVETAAEAIRAARTEAAGLRTEVAELRGQLKATEHRCDVLERTLIEHGVPVPRSGL